MEFTLLPKPAATGLNNFLEMVLGRQEGISGAMILRWIRDYKNVEVMPFFCECVICGDCCCYDLLVAFGGLRWDDAGEGAAVLLSDVLSLKSPIRHTSLEAL